MFHVFDCSRFWCLVLFLGVAFVNWYLNVPCLWLFKILMPCIVFKSCLCEVVLKCSTVFCMWPMQGAFNKHLELLTYACLILSRVTQTIITFLYTISSTFQICNLLLKLPWQGAVSCHPVLSLLLVLFFCCKGFEWRQVSKKSKTIWGINYCCQTKPPISFSTIKYSDYNAQTEMTSTYQLTHNIRYTLQITHIKVKEIICINIQQNEYEMLCNIYF
jgi:hypothetical protein